MAELSGVVIAGICLAGVLLLIPLIGNIIYQVCSTCKENKKRNFEVTAGLLKVGNNKPIPSGTLASINELYHQPPASFPEPDYTLLVRPPVHPSEKKTNVLVYPPPSDTSAPKLITASSEMSQHPTSSKSSKKKSYSTNWNRKKSSSKPAKHQHINPISPGYMYEYDGKQGSIYYRPDENE